MMNSTLILKSTRMMAKRLLERDDSDAARIREAWERALSRPPSAGEVDRSHSFIAQVEKAMEDTEKDPAARRLLAWESFCKALLASNEFIYLN